MNRRLVTALSAAAAALALAAAALGPAVASTPAVPIPPDARDLLLDDFTGTPAVARPYPAQRIPQHPFMARNGGSNIHDDAYQTDAYNRRGPLGRDLKVTSTLYVGLCGSVTFDRRGRIVTVCVTPGAVTLRLLDPKSLATIAKFELPPRKGKVSFTDFSGGGYFYLDHQDRAVVSTSTGHLVTIEVTGDTLTKVRDVDLSAATRGSGIQSALPDWAGRIWFVTQSGVVGLVTRSGQVRAQKLPAGETIANSFAMDESGGVFIASTHALYRYDARRDRPAITWRKAYDRGTRVKPGQVSRGTGTTPTLIGSAKSPGGGWVAITDNAEPRMHVVVFKRGKAGPGRALCRRPVFASGRGSDENSLVSVPGGLIAENNYGYLGPLQNGLGRIPDTEPGVARIKVDYRHGGCRTAWENRTARIPTVVAKASLGTGLLYAYTHPTAAELAWKVLPVTGTLAPDSWYFTAFDLRTGKQVFSRLTGSGIFFNNNYAPVTLGPDGAAYVGTVGGLLRIADGS
ncbi:hypothetical protein [Marmoricola sp. RAF53]|uniref:hypothetical protein n=1 Tax=Marmoricola sp. RAF53 TaxID=3233059 RepID=UPI003F96C1D1